MKLVIRIRPDAQDRIVLKNSKFTDFSDNAKALFEYLIDNGFDKKYQIIWCVSDPKKFGNLQNERIRFVTAEGKHEWTSFQAFYYGATSRFFFFTHTTAEINLVRCSDQTAVYIGHGNGYKALQQISNKLLKENYKFDFLLVSGPVFIEAKSRYWKCEKEKILDIGFPRYDWLLEKNDKDLILKQLFGTESNPDKVILWLPTFFNNHESGFPENSLNLALGFSGVKDLQELEVINQCCTDSGILMIIKKHPVQFDWIPGDISYSNIRFLDNEQLSSANITLPALMSISDALMTDYSSAAVDYLLLDRPIGFVLTDYEQYAQTRGFIFDNTKDYMPGEHLYCLQDIIQFIKNISNDIDLFPEKRNRMRNLMHNKTDCYCKRIVEKFIV